MPTLRPVALSALSTLLTAASCGAPSEPPSEPPSTLAAPAIPGPGIPAQVGSCPWQRLEAAVEAARARSLPLLVLIRQPNAPCPPADRIREGLCASGSFDAECVRAVADGGPEASPSERQFVMRCRAGQGVPPLLVVATAGLEILHVQAAGLFPFYDQAGKPLAEDPGPLLSSDEVLARVRSALARKADEDARLVALERQGTAEADVARAELLRRRGRWEGAEAAAARASADASLPMKLAARLYDLLEVTNQPVQAHALAERLLRARGEEQGAGWLALRLLRCGQSFGERAPEAQLTALIERAQRSRCLRLEACLRALRVQLASGSGAGPCALLEEDLRFLGRLAPDLFAPDDREGARCAEILAQAALRRRDFDEAEARALRLVQDYPDSPEALMYRHGLLDQVRRLRSRATPVAPGVQPPPR